MAPKDSIREDLQALVDDNVIPAIEEYYNQIQEEDWEDLRMGYEDIKENTKYLLKYLTTVFSDVVSDLIENQKFSYKDLKASFGNIISQAFVRAMGINQTVEEECTEIVNMLFLRHVVSMVTSPLDDEDPTEWLKVGLEFSSLLNPVITFVQKLFSIRKSFEEEQAEAVRLFVKSLISRGIRKSKTRWCRGLLRETQDRVVDKIFAEIEEGRCNIQQKWIPALTKKVFSDISKYFGCSAGWVLSFMEHEVVDDVILSCLERHLKESQEKRRSFFKRLFSSAVKSMRHYFSKRG